MSQSRILSIYTIHSIILWKLQLWNCFSIVGFFIWQIYMKKLIKVVKNTLPNALDLGKVLWNGRYIKLTENKWILNVILFHSAKTTGKISNQEMMKLYFNYDLTWKKKFADVTPFHYWVGVQGVKLWNFFITSFTILSPLWQYLSSFLLLQFFSSRMSKLAPSVLDKL